MHRSTAFYSNRHLCKLPLDNHSIRNYRFCWKAHRLNRRRSFQKKIIFYCFSFVSWENCCIHFAKIQSLLQSLWRINFLLNDWIISLYLSLFSTFEELISFQMIFLILHFNLVGLQFVSFPRKKNITKQTFLPLCTFEKWFHTGINYTGIHFLEIGVLKIKACLS